MKQKMEVTSVESGVKNQKVLYKQWLIRLGAFSSASAAAWKTDILWERPS